MPVDHRLVEILCCPATRVPVEPLANEPKERLNAAIQEGRVRYAGGATVDKPLHEALITTDGKRVYRVDDDIPVMLVELGIPMDQL